MRKKIYQIYIAPESLYRILYIFKNKDVYKAIMLELIFQHDNFKLLLLLSSDSYKNLKYSFLISLKYNLYTLSIHILSPGVQ